jgi:hypothetical protein
VGQSEQLFRIRTNATRSERLAKPEAEAKRAGAELHETVSISETIRRAQGHSFSGVFQAHPALESTLGFTPISGLEMLTRREQLKMRC